ncbi:MAG: addiction module protein [Aeromicrobium sp.]|uniref:addiction module protein n=1 Tax=Aeromicrobium sp. TaxID=1871063 RepID=UPI0039E2369A
MTTAELLKQARKLPREEQLRLAHDLYIEADGPYEDGAEVESAWASEIGQRLRGIVDGSEPGVPHDEVMKRFSR